MFNRLLRYLFLLSFSFVGTVPIAHASESLEYKLATINAGGFVSKDDITIARFRSLLNQLSETFVEDKQQIADMSVTAQNLLKKEGIQESLINILEGINQLFSRKVLNQKYAEYAAAYVTLRSKGQSHTEAIRGLQAVLRSMGAQYIAPKHRLQATAKAAHRRLKCPQKLAPLLRSPGRVVM